ncbi:MAG: hypothetical protein KZQ93_04740 [Candidatus Thiodiazotropha sp. (ex Monitilora ramsayi)]|nr:hypothetical protein [Candidatus Thiodiazotropha sp. (ex Monitilora ramsayi)]
MVQRVSISVLWIVALFYAYGALVHIMNMFSLTGINWTEAPLKWQALDIFYLIMDLIVAVGFILAWKVSYIVFYIAATSQIVLYTVFRDWIIEVPKQFEVSTEQISYLDTLVMFHVVTLICVSIVLWVTHNRGLQRTWITPGR